MILFTFEEKDEDIIVNQPQDDPSVTKYIKRYFEESKDEQEIGQHTKMMREAFKVVKKKQTSQYLKIIIAVGVLAVVFGAYSGL